MTSSLSISGKTVGGLIQSVAAAFDEAGVYYGHGTDNSLDEAAALVFHELQLEHAATADIYDQPVAEASLAGVRDLATRRIESREPLAYLINEAWFCGLPFTVDSRVLVPRSPVAELIEQQFQPWVVPGRVRRVLEIGTGSGCIAIACALVFPDAEVVATDISPDALAVAGNNVDRHGVADRVQLVETDHSSGVAGPFDIIVSNPPYVPDDDAAELPSEYHHEPALGLYSGADGLDSARRILQDAPVLLASDGILVLEVGAQWQALDAARPDLPFMWLEMERGGEGIGLLQAADLRASAKV